MPLKESEILKMLERSGALLKGHFLLRSGRHSAHYLQCARLAERLDYVELMMGELLNRVQSTPFDTVIAPAMGALVFGQEFARLAQKRFVFAEKQDGKLVLRRGFRFEQGERIFIIEDVVTQGGRVKELIELLKSTPAKLVGLGVLADRSAHRLEFGVPWESLLRLHFPTYAAADVPDALKALPLVHPGS